MNLTQMTESRSPGESATRQGGVRAQALWTSTYESYSLRLESRGISDPSDA